MKLSEIGQEVLKIQSRGKLLIVTDDTVAPLYLETCADSLRSAGFTVFSYILPAGEASKNGENFLKLLEFAAEKSLTRSDGIVALGGGMVGDLAGFTAACYLRGIRVIQVPTTLLSAVDSSVGGKTAIDLPAGKNLAGAFHQPELVLQDSSLLETLPEDVFLAGMAEVIKTSIIYDESLFEKIQDPENIRNILPDVIGRCVEIKKYFVEEDEEDRGIRHILNFGHTIGHAVEKLSGFSLSHGFAVAKGMDRMAELSVEEGWCSQETARRIHEILVRYGFDLSVPFSADEIFRLIQSDKKREGNVIRLVTVESIGRCSIRTVTMEECRALLEKVL